MQLILDTSRRIPQYFIQFRQTPSFGLLALNISLAAVVNLDFGALL